MFDHDPSISFCSDRTVAQSCSRVALKILRRNRTTFCSWTRQSTKSHSSSDVLGSVHLNGVQLAPSVHQAVGLGVQRLTCPRQHPFGSGRTGLVSGRFPATTGGATAYCRESRRLSATGISLLGHPVPPRSSAPLTIGLPRDNASLGPRRGFHVPRTRDTTGMGAPYTPGPAVFTRLATTLRSPLAASTSGQVLSPGCSSRRFRAGLTRHHQRFTCVRPSGLLPRPVAPPDGTGALGLLPSSFAPPARTRRRTSRWETDDRAPARSYMISTADLLST